MIVVALALVALASPPTVAERIVSGARRQVSEAANYTPGYFRIAYPNGDLPRNTGVCTDVVIRSLRSAGFDLQVLIHKDMAKHFRLYPRSYGLRKPDANIDHRRVPNQMTFFRRFGQELPLTFSSRSAATWNPGDIIYWKLDSGLDHCGIISDRRAAAGRPLVIHNLSRCVEEDCLASWKITGHFRYPR